MTGLLWHPVPSVLLPLTMHRWRVLSRIQHLIRLCVEITQHVSCRWAIVVLSLQSCQWIIVSDYRLVVMSPVALCAVRVSSLDNSCSPWILSDLWLRLFYVIFPAHFLSSHQVIWTIPLTCESLLMLIVLVEICSHQVHAGILCAHMLLGHGLLKSWQPLEVLSHGLLLLKSKCLQIFCLSKLLEKELLLLL